MAISPLHDKDLSKVEGQKYKKPHYHVIYVASNPVTSDSVRNKIRRSLGEHSLAMVQIISSSMESMYLYLTHESKDAIAKNKHIYSKADIRVINNFDIDRYVSIDTETKDEMLNKICELIATEGLANILELTRYIKYHGDEHSFRNMNVVNYVMRSHTGLIRLYFDGVYQERKYGRKIDYETGEIVTKGEGKND